MIDLKNKKLFLLDMDGTLYLGGILFPETLPFLKKVKENGGRYLFLTNNSSKSAEKYKEKLRGMGIEASEDDFVTSVEATIRHILSHHPGKKSYICGTEALKKQICSAGIPITNRWEEAELLLCGYDTELNYEKLEDCCRILTLKDVPFLATNPDWVCPTSYGYLPDCGSICEMLTRATGKKPVFIGKPQPDMVYMALEKTGYPKEQAVLIGDRLYTDIACANNAGIDGAYVLSGEGTVADIQKTGVVPAGIYRNIGEIAAEI